MKWQEYPFGFEGSEQHLNRVLEKKERLDLLRPLPAAALQNIKESLSLEWSYNSNSIEGNTLNLAETRMVIEDGMTIKGKSMREHFEAINHHNAINFVESLVAPNYTLAARDIMSLHGLVLQNIEREFAGRYRNAGAHIAGANFMPPNALKINALMDELIDWVNSSANPLPTIVKASIFHHRLVHIHPFFDGNGRTGRLSFNLLLLAAGFPPAIILKNDRKKYYDAINRANKGDYGKLLLLVLQALERSLDIYLGSLTNSYEDYQPIATIVQDPEVPYGQEYISLLARRGRIDALKEGRDWHTTKEAVLGYRSTRKRNRT